MPFFYKRELEYREYGLCNSSEDEDHFQTCIEFTDDNLKIFTKRYWVSDGPWVSAFRENYTIPFSHIEQINEKLRLILCPKDINSTSRSARALYIGLNDPIKQELFALLLSIFDEKKYLSDVELAKFLQLGYKEMIEFIGGSVDSINEKLLRLYAKVYIERNANLLLDHLSPIILYSRQSPNPMIMERHTFVNFLNSKLSEQRLTSEKFYGFIKLVKDDNDSLFLYIMAFSQEILISISTENELVTRIDVESINQRKFRIIDILFKPENIDDENIIEITDEGYIMIKKDDNPDKIMDFIIKIKYQREYCIAYSFDTKFIANLMLAGFIVMTKHEFINGKHNFVVKPTHHILRSVLKFENLHISKSIKRFINNYELKFNSDFETIINKCYKIHGDYWLTKPLIETIIKIRNEKIGKIEPVSFGVYKNGELKAGEFGIISGKVYTSYSGYHEENNAGNVQMILTAQYLYNHNFQIYDFGMPLKYKRKLGAKNIKLSEFLKIFRKYKA